MDNQSDIHGEVAALLDELLGDVQRVDEKEAGSKLRLFSATRLLRQDGNIRAELPERFEPDGPGSEVGARHRAQVVLKLDFRSLRVMRHDGGAGASSSVGENRRSA